MLLNVYLHVSAEPALLCVDSLSTYCVLTCGAQVLLCLFMIVGTLAVVKRRGFSLFCNEHDETDVELAFMLWVFYVSKILDFVDTCTCLFGRLRAELCCTVLLGRPAANVMEHID